MKTLSRACTNPQFINFTGMSTRLLVLYLCLFVLPVHVCAQISVDILGRGDTLAILDATREYRIRVNNLPLGAVVSMRPGTVVPLGNNEFKISGFDDLSVGRNINEIARLQVKDRNTVLFSRIYKLRGIPEHSDAEYGPKLMIRGHQWPTRGADTISVKDLVDAFEKDWVYISDTSLHLRNFYMSWLPVGQNVEGPWMIGKVNIRCGFDGFGQRPAPRAQPLPLHKEMADQIRRHLKDLPSGSLIFFEKFRCYSSQQQAFVNLSAIQVFRVK